jgi:tetratricopeptide (TPR) repeat protein
MSAPLESRPEVTARHPYRPLGLLLFLALLGTGAAGWIWWPRTAPSNPPSPDLTDADPRVAEWILQRRQEVLREPRSSQAWGRYGMGLRAHDFPEEANFCFREAEKLDPKEPHWPYLRGLTLVLTDPEAGIRCLERAAERAGDQLVPRLRLAEVLLEQGRLDEAEHCLQAVLQRGAGHPRARLALARLAFAREDWRGGLNHLEGLPSRKVVHTLRAEALHRLGDEVRTAAELKRARALPDDPPWPDPFVEEVERMQVGVRAQLARADSLARRGRVSEAMKLLEGVVKENPRNGRAWLLLGRTLLRSNRFAQAERALVEAVRLDAEAVEAWFQLGAARAFLGNPRGAAKAFAEVVRLKPDHTLGHYNLGLCLKELGDRAGAVREFYRTLRCQPDHAPAREALDAMEKENSLHRSRRKR